MEKITITKKQADQFNLMLNALRIIHKEYMNPEKLRRCAEKDFGCSYDEAIEMAYENIQSLAYHNTKGVKPIKPTA